MERNHTETSHVPFLSSQPGHILPHPLPCYSHYVFTSAGAAQGEIVLAVNTLLMQLFTLFSYIMDGFAYAGEALAGRYIGAKTKQAYVTQYITFSIGGSVFHWYSQSSMQLAEKNS